MIRHLTVGQLRICIAVICILFIWTTAKYMSYNLPSPTRKMPQTLIEPSDVKVSRVKTEVFYEVLCPDSRSFVLSQLVPTFRKLSDYMDVKPVPYGKAQTYNNSGKLTFQCQHGPNECLGNKVHACTLDAIPQQDVSLTLIGCMIDDNSNPKQAGESCFAKHNNSGKWPEVWSCAKGDRGSYLLALEGRTTDTLGKLDFVPTIRLNGSTERQTYILKDLFGEICRLYKDGEKPAACKS